MESIVSPLTNQRKEIYDPEKEYLRVPAPNIIEFVASPQYLNIPSVYEYKRQYQVLRDLFQCRCPVCNPSTPEAVDCWDKGKEYLQSEALLVWSMKYNDDVCPKCGTTRAELLLDKAIEKYNQLHGIVGMRSGKTATVAEIGAYIEHRLTSISISMPEGRLASYFGVLPKQPFEVTYIASTEVQSSDTIWAYYRSFRMDSPWFKRYVGWVKEQEKLQDIPSGMEGWRYQESLREIENGHIGVKFNSKNSNSGGLAGRTRIASFVDEISRFKQTESAMSAEEAYRVMENSLRTVRSAVINKNLLNYLGMMASISSPISIDDKGMELLYTSTRIKGMYSFHYATWEFNPFEKREYYDEAYEKDPVGTERDFAAKPPLAANPLIADPQKFEERGVDQELKATATLEILPFTDKTGQRYHKAHMGECKLLRDAARYICFPPGTKVLVENELKNIEDVYVGDKVITHNNRYRKVYDTIEHDFNGKLTTISLHKINGYDISCTPNHPIATCGKTGIEWKAADQITVNDYVRISYDASISNIKTIKLSKFINLRALRAGVRRHGSTRLDTIPDNISIDSDLMRLFGYYLAEGSITDKKQYVVFTFHKDEIDLINDIKTIVKNKFGLNVTVVPHNTCNSSYISINSVIIASLMDSIFGRGCRGKHIPTWIMSLPHKLQRSLLVGLYRGDGTCLIRKNNKYMVTLGLVNQQLIQSVWQLLLRLGVDASISKTKKPKLGLSEVWLCRYYTDNIGLTDEIFPSLVNRLASARSSYFIKHQSDGVYFKVKKISSINYSGPVYNLEVEDDHSYSIATNFTVHNCFDAGQNFDSFAGACGHLEIRELPDGNQEFVSVIDWVLKILPSNDMEVWFDSCVDIVQFQAKHQKIAQVEFDRWNSVVLIQQIRNLGVRAEQKPCRPVDFVKFVADTIMGRVRLLPKEQGDDELDPPFKSAAATGIYELERLERSIDDMRVYNPKKGERRGWNSDDVAVTLVHLHKMLQDSQVMPVGAKMRSREARLKREEVGSQQWQMKASGTIFSPARLGLRGIPGRRW